MKKTRTSQRRQESLSRDRILEASIELLDGIGEGGLTFQLLSKRLATGPGAIYWHVANKHDLLIASCDMVVARTMKARIVGETPHATIRDVALRIFDMIDAHPWIGSVLATAPGQLPTVRVLECIGQQVEALGVPSQKQRATAFALLNYILGVGAQNAANAQLSRDRDIDRGEFLDEVSDKWSRLEPDQFPFAHKVAGQLRDHDDREDFLVGIDLILRGLEQGR